MDPNRSRQAIRQWKVLRVLESRRQGETVGSLHKSIDEYCCERTIRRDLAALEQAGFPLVEKDGRWRVLQAAGNGGAARLLPLEPSHIVAVFLAKQLLADLPFAEPLDELRERLELLLHPAQREAYRELAGRLRASATASTRVGDPAR